jgi:hypothetical protein
VVTPDVSDQTIVAGDRTGIIETADGSDIILFMGFPDCAETVLILLGNKVCSELTCARPEMLRVRR